MLHIVLTARLHLSYMRLADTLVDLFDGRHSCCVMRMQSVAASALIQLPVR